jgi:hypothetical protein
MPIVADGLRTITLEKQYARLGATGVWAVQFALPRRMGGQVQVEFKHVCRAPGQSDATLQATCRITGQHMPSSNLQLVAIAPPYATLSSDEGALLTLGTSTGGGSSPTLPASNRYILLRTLELPLRPRNACRFLPIAPETLDRA